MDSGGSGRVSGSTSTCGLLRGIVEGAQRTGWRGSSTDVYSELAREKMWARIHLIPALQAEEDRDQVRRHLADKAREKELLGTETKVYHSDRYVTELRVDEKNGRFIELLQICTTYICDYARKRNEIGANRRLVVYISGVEEQCLRWLSPMDLCQNRNQLFHCVRINYHPSLRV